MLNEPRSRSLSSYVMCSSPNYLSSLHSACSGRSMSLSCKSPDWTQYSRCSFTSPKLGVTPAGCAFANTAQYVIDLRRCKVLLLAHVQFAAHQDLQVLFSWPGGKLGPSPSHMWDFVFAFELCPCHHVVKVLLQGMAAIPSNSVLW